MQVRVPGSLVRHVLEFRTAYTPVFRRVDKHNSVVPEQNWALEKASRNIATRRVDGSHRWHTATPEADELLESSREAATPTSREADMGQQRLPEVRVQKHST